MSYTPHEPPVPLSTRIVKDGGNKRKLMTAGKLCMFLSGVLFDSAVNDIIVHSPHIAFILLVIIVALVDLYYGLKHEW